MPLETVDIEYDVDSGESDDDSLFPASMFKRQRTLPASDDAMSDVASQLSASDDDADHASQTSGSDHESDGERESDDECEEGQLDGKVRRVEGRFIFVARGDDGSDDDNDN